MFPNFSCFGWCCSSNEDSIPARAIETATGAVLPRTEENEKWKKNFDRPPSREKWSHVKAKVSKNVTHFLFLTLAGADVDAGAFFFVAASAATSDLRGRPGARLTGTGVDAPAFLISSSNNCCL
jgi:hypothetical protein